MSRAARLLAGLRSFLFGGGGGNAWASVTATDYLPPRLSSPSTGSVHVTPDTAMRHSAVWACLRLRADLVSSMPVDVYRRVGGVQVEMPKPPILVDPGGDRVDMCEWLYSSQVDLDRAGNAVGLVTERNGAGLPARIDLQPLAAWSIRVQGGRVVYRVDGRDHGPEEVWHERQYTVSGLPWGLSPVAYAAWSIGQYQSAQQFATDWYGSGGVPKAHFRNTELAITDQATAEAMKARFKASVVGNDIFVTGKDWEYRPLQAEAVGTAWLESQQFGIADVARFFGCPGDLIDAATQGGSITYANVTQRNLQFLIMHLGPAIVRRERALSRLLPAPRYVKLNTGALLRMDPASAAAMIATQIQSRTLTPDEARELDNRPPLTEDQMAQFERLFTVRRISETVQAGGPAPEALVTDGSSAA